METLSFKQDAEWVEQARAGDFKAFESLVSRYTRLVYGVVVSFLHHSQDSEDTVQNVFLKAMHQLSALKKPSSFAAWIKRIAVTEALDTLRRNKRRKENLMDAADEDMSVPHPKFVSPWKKSPFDLMLQADTRRLLDEAIRVLPDALRNVFILRDIQEYSIQETALLLGITRENVKIRLLRARLALRESLTSQFGDRERAVVPNPASHVHMKRSHEPIKPLKQKEPAR